MSYDERRTLPSSRSAERPMFQTRPLLLIFIVFLLATAAARGLGAALPDSGQIAYQSGRIGGGDLYLLDVSHQHSFRLTRTPERRETAPAWSPDGQQLAFVAQDLGSAAASLVLRDLLTGHETALLSPGSLIYSAAWSPDGTRLAVDGLAGLRLIDRQSGDIAVIGFGFEPDWSLDGREIHYTGLDVSGGAFIGALLSDGSSGRFLTVGGVQFMDATLSPDGRWLVVVSSKAGTPDLYLLETACLPACQRDAQALTSGEALDYAPDWSADGSAIVFVRATSPSDIRLMWIDAAGGEPRPLGGLPLGTAPDRPAWRP